MLRKIGGFGILGGIARWVLRLCMVLALVLAGLIIAYRFVTPVSTLMLLQMVEQKKIDRIYVPLDRVSPHLIAALITSEDAHFCHDHGVDWGALREVIDQSGEDGPSRGASTITMQVARNLFLWQSRSYIRKGLEIPLALLLDFAWPKRRILEIYLNVAEWGHGIFGAEAASETYFHKSVHDLTPAEAALLVGVLPDPHDRDPRHPDRALLYHARVVMRRLHYGRPALACLRREG
ncbi:monofunctional biosynthetic peptidoglycan transglycosylase [Methylovirgula sp. HY1]|uniref:monofunctional biosynthetic peptidoglycan transglycosylase n=1 Tax=Methylovirgula sp. HY1 TaxID=2822761 RepID=UPI001C5A6388|nr:monofunctional biosynthetic peptidoglycan transglycosylase [Methylovirgula sp. HY1]QXX74830.1 Biosynthetic peptidoglycan transglycosylase [Methylovirgula sp. HY1]